MNEQMTETEMKRAARRHLIETGAAVHGRRGRTDGPRRCSTSTPVVFVDGASAPALEGLPYWKTHFRAGNFRKVLYTPSTLHVVVGRGWPGLRQTETAKERTRRAARIYAWVARIQVTAADFQAQGACAAGIQSWCTEHGVCAASATLPLSQLLTAGGRAATYALRIAKALYSARRSCNGG